MLTVLKDPVFEAWKVRLDGDPKTLKSFLSTFMDSAEGGDFRNNPDGAPGIFVYDQSRPLGGLQSFGFESAERLEALYENATDSPNPTESPFSEGDVLLVQARSSTPLSGGSTELGRLRRALYLAAIEAGLVNIDPQDRFLWVTDFPMFTPNESGGSNDQGRSGFSATHHPFTAPKSAADVELLLTDPLSAIADHYDLVLNGVELGGGSRRIHSSEMQQFIMRDILKV
jgi:aspartyl-tRNA synthetase